MNLTIEAVSAARAQLFESGFRPIPIVNHDAKGPSPGKRPLGQEWQLAALKDPPFCVVNPAVEFALNTGILCNGLRAIDIDVDDAPTANRIRAMAVDRFGEAPIRMRRNSPRCLILYRASTGQPPKIAVTGKAHTQVFALKVEVLGAGQQFVAFGKHDSGADLEWFPEAPGEISLDLLPAVDEDSIREFLTDVANLIDAEPPGHTNGAHHHAGHEAQAEPLRVAAAIAAIPNNAPADWEAWNRLGMAIWSATGGSAIGGEIFNEWSKRHPSYDPAHTEERWRHYQKSPPTSIGAGTLFHMAGSSFRPEPTPEEPPAYLSEDDPGPNPEDMPGEPEIDWDWGKQGATGPATRWPTPLNIFQTDTEASPQVGQQHIPDVLWAFVKDTSIRMGVDPTSIALGSLVTCASVIHDDWKVQPKRHDKTWTESARVWGCIVGDPSSMKSPVIMACTRVIDRLEADARKRHDADMEIYEIAFAAWKKIKDNEEPAPRAPKLLRYLVEGATMEAFQEVLRDDPKAKQRAVAGKVLCRQDEMSEWAGNLDRYGGGKGGGDRGAYLRLYNGGRFTVDRIARGSFAVSNWSACFLTGCQPEPIQKIARDASEDGLLQRFIYAVPPASSEGMDQPEDEAALDGYYATVRSLAVLRPLTKESGYGHEHVQFHELAHVHREAIDKAARAIAMIPDTSNRVKSTVGKWPGLFARLCLTFHMIEAVKLGRVSYIIPEATAAQVKDYMLEIVLPHLIRADATMFLTPQTGHARWVAGYILAHDVEVISTRDIVRAYRQLRSPEQSRELTATMNSLVAVGWLDPIQPRNPLSQVNSWRVNPDVHVQFEERARQEAANRAAIRAMIRANNETYAPLGFASSETC